MSKNYISLALGGKERGIKFNMGALEHLEEISGKDPLIYTVNTSVFKEMLTSVIEILFAGLLANCDLKKEQPDFTKADVSAWVADFDMQQCVQIINAFGTAYKTDSSEEGSAPAEPFQLQAAN